MKSSPHLRPINLCSRPTAADWAFRIVGAGLVLAVFVIGASLDEPATVEVDTTAAFQRGVAEGRSQMLAAHGERSTLAYQRGLLDGRAQCSGDRQ